jgi:two-component system, OmpR family, phosphate regulon response regulator PhoB
MSQKILLIDDDPVIHKVYGSFFEKAGFQVSRAINAEEALRRLKESPPDLVLLDLYLPRIPGIEILRHIRSSLVNQNLPVIVFSHSSTSRYIDQAYQLGVTRCLTKEYFNAPMLLQFLRSVIPLRNDTPTRESDPDISHEFALGMVFRNWLRSFLLRQSDDTRLPHLADLHRKIENHLQDQPGPNLSHENRMARALLRLLQRMVGNPENLTPSTLRTTIQAVDCLATLHQRVTPGHSAVPPLILIVDPQRDHHALWPQAFLPFHQRAITQADPFAALSLLEQNPIDLIFWDWEMPRLSGLDLCVSLRKLPQHKQTPLIFLTSLTEFETRSVSDLGGAHDLIAKPVLLDELVAKTLVYLSIPHPFLSQR